MHIEMIAKTVYSYWLAIKEHAVCKFIFWLIPWLISTICWWHQQLINIMLALFFFDLITWLAYAIKSRMFSSNKFIKWAFKLATYWIILIIWLWLDLVFHTWEFMIWIMFSFIILTDSISIVENLHKLWFNTPYFLIKYMEAAQEKLSDKVWKILDIELPKKK